MVGRDHDLVKELLPSPLPRHNETKASVRDLTDVLANRNARVLGARHSTRADGSLTRFGRVEASQKTRLEEQPPHGASMGTLRWHLPHQHEPRNQEEGKLRRHVVLIEHTVSRLGLVSCHEEATRWSKVYVDAFLNAVHTRFEQELARIHPLTRLRCVRHERHDGNP